ncbi:MAG: hypothetical protein GWN00_19025, partial [Aliifodinibius sp.]|nr:hypothetical protein [Phycisphaerae bacterium]NIT58241.1 hypothetical protein [Fodinibius sp.]NIS53194.1 hypothetical protein [Phycisphaerae bacterium]NIV13159.1 hypothetical protein [Fodinibius sp.]NIX02242.1 hypothetical protein [Phycisphaerae bacterium]
AYFINETGTSGSDYNYAADNECSHINWDTDFNYNSSYDGHCVVFQSGSYNVAENNTAEYTRFPFQVFTFGSESSTDNVFRNNKVTSAEYGGIDLYDDTAAGNSGSQRSKIYSNIIANAAQYSAGTKRAALRIARTKGSAGTYIFNNTIYNSYYKGTQIKDGVDYTYWQNNIVWTAGVTLDDNQLTSEEATVDTGSNYDVDYNLYWTGSGDPSSYNLWADYDETVYPWSTWKSTAGHDTNSPSPANPSFVDTT